MIAQADIRFTLADGTVVGISYLDEGFASTVPCTSPGCFMAAHVLCYDLSGGTLWRRCSGHMDPSLRTWLDMIASDLLHQRMKAER